MRLGVTWRRLRGRDIGLNPIDDRSAFTRGEMVRGCQDNCERLSRSEEGEEGNKAR